MALDKSKCNPELGKKIHDHLVSLGCETPLSDNRSSYKVRQARLETSFTRIMENMNLDLEDDSLQDTPKRVAKMFLYETCWGLDYDNFPKITAVENKAHYHDLLVERVSIQSLCEHHWVYFGTSHNPSELGCWIAYIPKDKVLGLSKLNRVAEFFSRRPQIQERLTKQIAESLKFILETDDVAVVMKAQHFCVLTRGVEDANSYTISSHLSGAFEKPEVRAELMAIVNR